MGEIGCAMRFWAAASAAIVLTAAARADCGPAALERAILDRVTPEGALLLKDARLLRLAGLHEQGSDRSVWPKPGDPLAVGLLDDRPDRWGRLPALVFTLSDPASPAWLQGSLIERGVALARPEPGLAGCWPLLAGIEAAAGKASALPAEGGRFARIEGRVSRVGEGRSAHFITLWDAGGTRVTGLVQKRHLARFRQAGVDVPGLRGHVIRLRGIRSATNASMIPLMTAEQIEIVR